MSVNIQWIQLEPHELLEDGVYGFYRCDAETALRLNIPLEAFHHWELSGWSDRTSSSFNNEAHFRKVTQTKLGNKLN